jgi:methylmalonyl-CoA/ethylmalonyl-CoA epimerase
LSHSNAGMSGLDRPGGATRPVLDHVAIGTLALTDGWDLFGGLLGGSWVYGGDSPGFWWGQLQFAVGPKIEILTPTGGPDAAFLERFLAARGASPHHFNFIVPDISATLSRVRAAGIEPVQVSLQSPTWKEAFLHPKDAYGIVVQVAEQSGKPPELPSPAELMPAPLQSAFALVEHRVGDMDGALRLFADALEGQVVALKDAGDATIAELTWDNGARLRLVQPASASSDTPARGTSPRRDGGLGHLCFTREWAEFTPAERSQIADLARRLGVSVELGA